MVFLVLVDLDTLHLPVDVLEGLWVGANKVNARLGLGATALAGPDIRVASGITTEGDVEHQLLLADHTVDVAAVATDMEGRAAPETGVGGTVAHIGRHFGLRPLPDGDVVGAPLHGVDTTGGVSPKTTVVLGGTALVKPLGRRALEVVVAIFSLHLKVVVLQQLARAHGGGLVGVQRDAAVGGRVPALIHVELAHGGPRVAEHPVRRPGSAHGLGEVREVGDEKAVGVQLLALQAHTVTARAELALVLGVDSQPHLAVLSLDQTQFFGILPVAVVDEAVGWVNIKRVARRVVALQQDVGQGLITSNSTREGVKSCSSRQPTA